MKNILRESRGILRDGDTLAQASQRLVDLRRHAGSPLERARIALAEAMVRSAGHRQESRGSHFRLDFPETDEKQRKTSVVRLINSEIQITYEKIK